MKTNQEPRRVNTQTSESRDFTIKANGKAFKILIDGLYENKIQSIVREIWSNALDSHVAAGVPNKPFSVTFPSIYNPTFSVRDYGTSLSHEDVMGLYSTVFESTKEDTNSAVGKFGLGSKSPFAYTDTFTVTAFMDGEKRVYSALISEDGVPQIHFMGRMNTDEPNGIEVAFPIETRDIDAFRKAALRVSHGFDVKPEVIRKDGEPEFEGWPELEVLEEGTGWKLLSGNIEGYRPQTYAKMGCVLYPINADAIDGLTVSERLLLQSTLVVEFAVGDLEISASRESLSYGPKDPTANSIRARIKTIVHEMVTAFMTQYDSAGTYWEACQLFREHLSSPSIPQAVKNHLKMHAEFDGKLLQITQSIGTGVNNDVRLPHRGIQVCAISGNRLTNAVYRFDYNTTQTHVHANKDVVFFIEDLESPKKTKHVPEKIRSACVGEQIDLAVWIKYTGGREAAQALINLLHAFDGADFRHVSELPDIPKNGPNGTYLRRQVQVRVLRNGRFEDRVNMSEETFAKGGFYVPLERNQPKVPEGCADPSDVWRALRKYPGLLHADAELYGAPKSLWKHFEGDQWVNVYDLAVQTFEKHQPKKLIAKARYIETILGDATLRFLSNNLRDANLATNSLIRSALALYDDAATSEKPAVGHVVALAKVVGHADTIEQWISGDIGKLDELKEKLNARYPLLEVFDNWHMRDSLDKLEHYIYVCDTAAEHDSAENETATTVAA